MIMIMITIITCYDVHRVQNINNFPIITSCTIPGFDVPRQPQRSSS